MRVTNQTQPKPIERLKDEANSVQKRTTPLIVKTNTKPLGKTIKEEPPAAFEFMVNRLLALYTWLMRVPGQDEG